MRTGQVQLFTTTEELASERRVALDAALSFAESMGFLFDDDEVSIRGDLGSEEAARLWRELCGEAAEPEHEAQILLEEPIQASPQLPPALVLSKFRRAGSVEPVPNRERAPDVRLRLVSRF